jgi:hypothetical protein
MRGFGSSLEQISNKLLYFDAGPWGGLLKWILGHFPLDAGAFDRWKLTSGTATRGASLSLAADEERAWQAGEDSVHGAERELILCAARAAQSKLAKSQDALEVGK